MPHRHGLAPLAGSPDVAAGSPGLPHPNGRQDRLPDPPVPSVNACGVHLPGPSRTTGPQDPRAAVPQEEETMTLATLEHTSDAKASVR